MGAPKQKPKLTKGGAREWSAGDRIGKTYPTHLREQLVRSQVGLPIDREAYEHAIEICLKVFDAIHEADALDEVDIPIEEVPDAIARLNTFVNDARTEASDEETKHEQRVTDLMNEHETADKEHADDIAEHCKTIDELRARAELAEHERDELRATLAPYAKPMRKRSAAKPVSFAAMCAESASKAASEHGNPVTMTITPARKR